MRRLTLPHDAANMRLSEAGKRRMVLCTLVAHRLTQMTSDPHTKSRWRNTLAAMCLPSRVPHAAAAELRALRRQAEVEREEAAEAAAAAKASLLKKAEAYQV